MKNYQTLYKDPQLKGYFLFTAFFFFIMNLSKSVQVLWFDQNGQLGNFGLSYSAMAFAGALSFIYSSPLLRCFKKNPLFLPLVLYAIGMSLRVFTGNPWIATISGFVSGVGASTALNAFRTFMVSTKHDDRFELILSHKNVLQQSASALGTAAIGVAIWTLNFTGNPYPATLIVSAVAMFLLFALWPNQNAEKENMDSQSSGNSWKLLIRDHSFKTLSLIVFSFLTGIAISCTAPFLLVILKRQGLAVSSIGLLVGSGVFIGAGTQTFITPKLKKNRYLSFFIFSEVALAVGTWALSILGASVYFVAAVYITRLFVLSLSLFLQESLEYRLIPSKHASEILGMMQSVFLLGDMTGGSLGGLVSQKFGVDSTLHLGSALFALNGILFVICIKIIQARESYLETAATYND